MSIRSFQSKIAFKTCVALPASELSQTSKLKLEIFIPPLSLGTPKRRKHNFSPTFYLINYRFMKNITMAHCHNNIAVLIISKHHTSHIHVKSTIKQLDSISKFYGESKIKSRYGIIYSL